MKDSKNTKAENAKRRLLKQMSVAGSVAGSAAIVGTWKKPLVDSIVLPVHAMTSMAAPGSFVSELHENSMNEFSPDTIVDKAVDMVVQNAHAVDLIEVPVEDFLGIKSFCGTINEEGVLNFVMSLSGTTGVSSIFGCYQGSVVPGNSTTINFTGEGKNPCGSLVLSTGLSDDAAPNRTLFLQVNCDNESDSVSSDNIPCVETSQAINCLECESTK